MEENVAVAGLVGSEAMDERGRVLVEAALGAAWDDPKLAIAWPLPEPILSERDRSYPPL